MAQLFKHAHLVCPERNISEAGWLAVENGVITASSFEHKENPDETGFSEIIDCKGQILGPGFVDMRAQSSDPGAEHIETLDSLLTAATSHGITSLAILPSTEPVIDNAAMIDSIQLRAGRYNKGRLYCYGAATKQMAGEQMAELGMMTQAGAIGFSTGNTTISDSQMMRRLMTYAKMFDRPVMHHCEDPALSDAIDMNEGETATRLGLIGQPAIAETIILQRDIALARLTGVHYHASHISAASSVDVIRQAKREGLSITADTAPPYFMLNEISVSGFDSAAKLNPPLRTEDDRLAIIAALLDGTIDAIASDHMPIDPDEKAQPFSLASFGASGLDVLVPMSLKLRQTHDMGWPHLFSLMSYRPAQILGLAGGKLGIGAPADLVMIKPDSAYILKSAGFKSQSRITPFEGTPCEGKVTGCWVGGKNQFQQ